jgi:1-acyl-sn-glycerol-3-phosphate acyltransferase
VTNDRGTLARPPSRERSLGQSSVLALLRLLVRAFFRRVEVSGQETLPVSGGGIVVSWHPNGMIDPGLILTQCPRRIVFGARHGLFRWPLLGRLMHAIGCVPLYRASDASPSSSADERRAKNRQSLDTLASEVAAGGLAAIFPEGASHDEPHLLELKTGAARLYYRARQLAGPSATAPAILPVGLHYDEKRGFRSNALVVFNPPLELPEALDLTPVASEPEDASRERAGALTAEIERALREVVHATESWELNHWMHRTRKLVRSERAKRASSSPGKPAMLERAIGFARVWAGYYAKLLNQPEETRRLRERIGRYDADLRAIGLEDHELDADPRLASPWLPVLLLLQVGLVYLLLPPILVVGWIINAPTAALLWGLARATSRAYKDEASVKLLFGSILFPLTWFAWAALVAWGQINLHATFPAIPKAPLPAALACILLGILGGAVALRYTRLATETWRSVRVRITRRRRRHAVRRLLDERAALFDRVTEMAEGLELPGAVAADGRIVSRPGPLSEESR